MKTLWFWLVGAALVIFDYWFCLRFLFPLYFEPLSAFHVDFYDFAATGVKTFYILFSRYSRPVSFAIAKLLADSGFRVLLTGEIVIVDLGILLTLALSRRVLNLQATWGVLALFGAYVFVLFAHPQFYAVHRHDLPADCAYLFLVICLLFWTYYTSIRCTSPLRVRLALLTVTVLFAALSTFSKETYFVSALCLIAGLALSDRPNRKSHLQFLLVFIILDCCSYAWNKHAGWPPTSEISVASDPYKISLAPFDLARTFFFYVSKLLNPALILLPLVGIALVWRNRQQYVIGFAFLASGLAAFLPHAILPNHLDPEYSWLGAPLFFVPFLLISKVRRWTKLTGIAILLAIALPILAIVGPRGYESVYKSNSARWFIGEDRRGAAIVQSLPRLQQIPKPARVLVVGLEHPAIPWEAGDFVQLEFGSEIQWSIVLPEAVHYRRSSRLVDFPHASEVDMVKFTWVVTYSSSGELLASFPAANYESIPRSFIIVPALKQLISDNRKPNGPERFLASARMAAAWGLWAEATGYLNAAKHAGALNESTAVLSREISLAVAGETAQIHGTTLVARPSQVVQPDGSGLGEVELFWNVPEGVAAEIHVNSPDGTLFARSEGAGHGRTGKWVTNGMKFFVQDVSGGKPLDLNHTLAHIEVEVSR